jgi:hypothetical protein
MAQVNTTNILEKFNRKETLGDKFDLDDKRNPREIALDKTGKYDINQLVYPEDLSVSKDLQHYIVFYVNVRGKSKFKPKDTVPDINVGAGAQNRMTGAGLRRTADVMTAATVAAASATFLNKDPTNPVASVAKKGVNLLLSRFGVSTETITNVIAIGAGIAAAGATHLSENLKTDEPARISDAIMLPIDSIPEVSYAVKYDTVDLGAIGGLLGGSSAVDSTALGRTGEAAVRGLLALADVGKIVGLNPKQALLLAGKVQTNPFREVFFESVDYRTFSFNYTFLPKSEAEVYNVKRIIDLFKFHMHPELSTDGLFYVYPSEFEMQYYFKGKENQFVHKISTCVLKNMTVKYGGQYFTSFENGSPAEITMKLDFQELELLTKERIIKGF